MTCTPVDMETRYFSSYKFSYKLQLVIVTRLFGGQNYRQRHAGIASTPSTGSHVMHAVKKDENLIKVRAKTVCTAKTSAPSGRIILAAADDGESDESHTHTYSYFMEFTHQTCINDTVIKRC